MAFFGPRQLGVDLGTVNVVVYAQGKGIVISEPSVVAVSMPGRKIQAVGGAAREMIGRNPGSIRIMRPMREGVIADYVVTEAILRYFIDRVCGRFRLFQPEMMISVPTGVTGVERRAVSDAAVAAGCKSAALIAEPLAAAIGARVPISAPSGNMIINVGGGTTEIAVISLNDIVVSSSVRVAGNKIDGAISNHIRRQHNLLIGDPTAEEIKIAIGSATQMDEAIPMEVRGRDQVAGLPRTVTITSDEVAAAISDPVQSIVRGVKSVLEQTPPELAADIIDKGMVMTGGGSLLRNLDELLTDETGIPCHVADQPLMCVALGTGIALEHFEVLRKVLVPK
ncbi:MAG TPA: rod shape-determining protein [Chloroflexota bacterium]|nr:rod shape-determining protein [Chloroflexota bacterium]